MDKTKPFCISKQAVWRAYERVKANKGAAGVDGQSIEDFEKNLKKNLYKIWNRMSSGSYVPPPVKAVPIPKKGGGTRQLGIPTIADRIAQTVVKMELEPALEPIFHDDSFGYRPGRSAHQAIRLAKTRCWHNPWVIDLDIRKFFDSIDHDLMMKAVRAHTKCEWIVLYIERWLKAGVLAENGSISTSEMGTPQGGVISPLLANLFLHYAFDVWMRRTFPAIQFERYADDIIVHCRYLNVAQRVLQAIGGRMAECKLTLHPEKTKIAFCQNRMKKIPEGFPTSFDFLGFTFRQRRVRNSYTGKIVDGFMPGISQEARREISRTIHSWNISRATTLSLKELSNWTNPIFRGWVNYYGKFHPQALKPIWHQWSKVLTSWAMRKYKTFGDHRTTAGNWIADIERREPKLFAIWEVFQCTTRG